MDFKAKLFEYKSYVVIAGLAIGALNLMEWLPETLPLAEQYTSWLYVGIIALAGYTFWEFFYTPPSEPIRVQRTVPHRNISSGPAFQQDLQKQFGSYGTPQPMRRTAPRQSQEAQEIKAADSTFAAFQQE